MVLDSNAVTPIRERSFASLAAAHLAATLVVCGGLAVLLPAPAVSQALPATISAIFVTDWDASANPAGDDQLTGDDAEFSASQSDEGHHNAPTGSAVCITADQCRSISDADVLRVVPVKVVAWISRSVEGHALRGPPADDQTSSDTDDLDGDDDDPIAECPDLLPPATSCETCFVAPAQFVSASSTRSTNLSLRAPPL